MDEEAGVRQPCAPSAWTRALVAGLSLLAPTLATAGPPYTTDDPEPVELHHWEIYVATMDQWARDTGWSGTAPHLDVNYGVLPGVHAHITTPVVWVKPPGAPAQIGYGDTELGAKVRLVAERAWVPQISTYPLIEIPTGDSSRGLGNGRAQLFLPLWVQKTVGAWTLYGGGGRWINPGPGNRDWWYVGGVVQRQLIEGVALGAEVFHGTPRQEGLPGDTRFNLGLVVDLSPVHHLLISAGHGIGAESAQGYLAWQITFGPGGETLPGSPEREHTEH